jgi:ESCRT-II complex subunit VPS22
MRAVEKLKVLGNGFELIALGNGRFLVQSVPGELSMDHSRVLQLADHGGFVTRESISDRLHWDETRVANALEHLTKQGIAWIDEQAPDDTVYYWFPSLFLQLRSSPTASELSDSVASLSACQSSVDVQ